MSLVGALSFVACDGSTDSALDVVTPDDGAQRVEVVSVLVEVERDDGRFLDPRHVLGLHLKVNGRSWGVLRADSSEVAPDTWTTTSTPAPVLLIFDLVRATTASDAPGTLGGWVELLDRLLGPGGYVATAVRLDLGRGQRIESVPVHAFLPFEVSPDEGSAFLGALRLTLASGAGS